LQYRGQQQTYLQRYPGAENLILFSESGKPAGRLLLDRQTIAGESSTWPYSPSIGAEESQRAQFGNASPRAARREPGLNCR